MSHESIDGEVVAVDMESGVYYSLVDLGARIWELAAGGWTREELLVRVAAAYPEEPRAREEVGAFLDELVGERLLIEDTMGERNAEAVELPAAFAPPRIERFTDLQEMLMLDPIHEVDAAAGWPYKAG